MGYQHKGESNNKKFNMLCSFEKGRFFFIKRYLGVYGIVKLRKTGTVTDVYTWRQSSLWFAFFEWLNLRGGAAKDIRRTIPPLPSTASPRT